MELGPCPYADSRQGEPMNLSALEQITRHLKPVFRELRAFHAALPAGSPSHDRMFLAVLDQLAGPARRLLSVDGTTDGTTDGTVPAPVAVGHKLAAGYFDVMRPLRERRACGVAPPADVDAFLAFVAERRALHGASEVCGGPPRLLRRTTALFLGQDDDAPPADPARPRAAALLAAQIDAGVAWELHDRRLERALLSDPLLRTRNPFLARELDAAREGLEARAAAPVDAAVRALPPDAPDALREALAPGAPVDPDCRAAVEAVASAGALLAADEASLAGWKDTLARYVQALGALRAFQREQEEALRACLGAPAGPVAFSGLLVPRLRAKRWLQAGLGLTLRSTPDGLALWSVRGGTRALPGGSKSAHPGPRRSEPPR